MNNSELVCNLTPSGKLAKSMSMDILFYLTPERLADTICFHQGEQPTLCQRKS